MTSHPRLRTILLFLSLIVLFIPLGGIAVLRLYENELVKQTEAELISQTALIVAVYKQEYFDLLEEIKDPIKRSNIQRGNSILLPLPPAQNAAGLTPVLPELDLSNSPIHPPAEPPVKTDARPDPLAQKAGKRLAPVILDAKKTNLSGIRIVDHQGIVVATSGDDAGTSLASRHEVALALQGNPNSLIRRRNSDSPKPALTSISRGTKLRVFVALPVIIENRVTGVVVTSRTPLDVDKALYASRYQLLKGGLFMVAAVLFMTVLATLYIRRPIKALLGQVDQIKRGDKAGQTPIQNPAIEEVAQLSDAIAQMAVTLEQRADYIKTFAANVSHEFKTPLTSLHGAVEILKEHYTEMTFEEREKFLTIIDNEAQHLDTQVKKLLELARAEVYQRDNAVCAIRPVLDKVVERYRDGKLKIQMQIDDSIHSIMMSPDIFSSILYNLLDNAVLHNPEGCNVRIMITRDPGDEQPGIMITIRDDGRGISDANASRIFRPFFTTARDRGGSGLGLTIIKSLIEAHGGSIELLPGNKGASFLIKIPASP